jgi:hypothetical protein
VVLVAIAALAFLSQSPQAGQSTLGLTGKWALNRALSQFPRELGFDANFRSMAVDEQEAAERGRGGRPPSRAFARPESADEGARKQQLTDEVREPAANLTITDTPDAVTLADDRGRTRTFHPNGKEELIQLGGVGVVTITRRDAGQLVVLYEVAEGRQIRYTFSRLDDPARLVVETQFIDRGNADTVMRLYEPAKAVAPSTTSTPGSSAPGSAPPTAGTPSSAGIPGPGAEFRGLSELGVVVEELSSQSTGCGLNQGTLETAVSKHLTEAGLKPRRNSDEDTYVYVNISTATVSNGLCVSRYDVYLTTHTMARLSYQDRPVLVEVTLMHKGSMAGGAAPAHTENVMKGVLDDVDEIASRIREANR